MAEKDDFLFYGIVVPVFTPFTEDKQVDYDGLATFVDWLCSRTVHVLFPMGGSGEWWTLTVPERRRIMDVVLETAGQRVAVVPNVGAKSLRDTLELCEYACRVGANAVGVVIPDTLKAGQDSLYDFFAKIDQVADRPIMIYDPRGEGPLSPTPETVVRMLDELEHIAAMKYRTTNAERMANMCWKVGNRMTILSGVEFTFLSDLAYGAQGVVGGGCNIFPEEIYAIQKAFEDGDIEQARQNQFRVLEINQHLAGVDWPTSGKLAVRARGVPITPVSRANVREPSPRKVQEIETFFAKL